jgi:hypothetical protein
MPESKADFICVCGGVYTVTPGKIVDGMRAFRCDSCGREGPLECPLCRCPRTIWRKYGESCFFCGQGQRDLTALFRRLINAGSAESN